MSKKENVSVRLTKEHEEMATIPKLNSALFTTDNYEVDNSLLLYEDKIREYAIGWCYTDELPMRVNTTFHREIAVMYEDPENEEKPKFWMHLGLDTFIVLFIPKMLEEDNKPSLVEELKQRLAEKDKQIAELKANQTPTRKKLSPKNWDKYNLADKLRYRNSQVKEALIRMSDMNEMEGVLRSQLKDQRHQICEKIRYYLLNHVWCDKDCRYVADIDKELDKIEKGE